MPFFKPIISGGTTTTGYVRPTGVPDGETILANAPDIESGGVTYKPIYYICAMDTVASPTLTKTGAGVSTGADAYVFSDEPETLYVGTSVSHTFDTTDDYDTEKEWKCRYVIMYATEANKASASGITVNLYSYTATFEFIASTDTIFSSATALFGSSSSSACKSIQYINCENASFYDNTISENYFCEYNQALQTLKLPNSITTVSGGNFCYNCYSLTSISLPALTTVSGGNFCYNCYSLVSLSLPALTTVSGSIFCAFCYSLVSLSLPALTTVSGSSFCRYCYSLTSLSLPSLTTVSGSYFCISCYSLTYIDLSVITSWADTSASTLNYTRFIELITDFDIDAVDLTGTYTKSYEWLNDELPTKLKDNSSGTAKTMTIGATNLAMITTANQAIITAKNWTLS